MSTYNALNSELALRMHITHYNYHRIAIFKNLKTYCNRIENLTVSQDISLPPQCTKPDRKSAAVMPSRPASSTYGRLTLQCISYRAGSTCSAYLIGQAHPTVQILYRAVSPCSANLIGQAHLAVQIL